MKKIKILALLLILAIPCFSQSTEEIDCRIRNVLQMNNIPPFTIKLLISQAKLESGNYSNGLVKKHCNLFSMRHPTRRATCSIGPLGRAEKRKGFASFNSIEDSVLDQLLYFEHIGLKLEFKTTRQFVRELKKHHYFESSELKYENALKVYNKQQL